MILGYDQRSGIENRTSHAIVGGDPMRVFNRRSYQNMLILLATISEWHDDSV